MTEEQKIKDWISKEQDGLMDAQGNFEYPEHEGAYHILCNLDAYIDSLQEEPKFKTGDRIKPIDSCLGSPRTIVDVCDSWYVTDQGTLDFEYEDNWELAEKPKQCMYSKDSYTDEDRKVLCDGCEEECKYNKKEPSIPDIVDEHFDEMLGEEPVSEDIEKEIEHAHKLFYEEVGWDSDEGARAYVADWFAYYFANWQKEHLWKPADGDDLPEYDREVIAILDYDFGHYKVVYAHRPFPDGWNGTNIDTGKKEHFEPEIYDKGGWNQPHVLYWLDAKLPYEEK